MHAIVRPRHLDDLRATLRDAATSGRAVSIAGGHHSMGGQQFGEDTVLVDTRGLDQVLAFDRDRGLITVEGGVQWPALLAFLDAAQHGTPQPWTIYQRQTGADHLTLAGALSCNAHGRGLTLPPIVGQVESFDLVDAAGDVLTCSRDCNQELFALAVGGYGLFGIIARVTLRLRPRVKVRRVVTVVSTEDLMARFAARIREGFLYGDFQFAIDPEDDGFLRQGVFSCYEPVPLETQLTEDPVSFCAAEWASLVLDAHRDKRRAFERYADRYLQTSRQIYWCDDQGTGAYVDGYHADVDRALGCGTKATEMITELYVPRDRFEPFMEDLRATLRQRNADVIYGTVRLIERDTETFMAWAREPYVCVVLNLHVVHEPAELAAAAETFRELIDAAIRHDGTYYLTYHRWARPDQIERCYPQMRAFLAAKRRFDPDERFQSNWYRWHRDVLGMAQR